MDDQRKKALAQLAHPPDDSYGDFFATTPDRVVLAYLTHLHARDASRAWLMPAGLALTILLALLTADFKERFGLPSAVWTAIFVLSFGGCVIWTIVAIVRREREPTVDAFLEKLRPRAQPETPQARLVNTPSVKVPDLTRGGWILLYNPQSNKGKPITFLRDGSVGLGRNQNEASWQLNERDLELLNEGGKIHSRFRWSGEDWQSTNETNAVANQVIFRPGPRMAGMAMNETAAKDLEKLQNLPN